MADTRFRLYANVAEFLENLTNQAQHVVRRGFSSLANISPDNWEYTLTASLSAMEMPDSIGAERLAAKLGCSEDDAVSIVNAVGLLATALSAYPKSSPEDFVEAAVATKVIKEESRDRLLKFSNFAASQRDKIDSEITGRALASEVLPSLSRFDVTIDVRLRFEKDSVARSRPVAVVHLDTDSEGQLIWFQVNQMQLERIIEKLTEARRRLDAAEIWAEDRTKINK